LTSSSKKKLSITFVAFMVELSFIGRGDPECPCSIRKHIVPLLVETTSLQQKSPLHLVLISYFSKEIAQSN
ncbi:hypothetical protein AVEN_74869-1, partial [Araneus ventricosus]